MTSNEGRMAIRPSLAMNLVDRAIVALLTLSPLTLGAEAKAEAFGNEELIALAAAKLGDAAMLAKIESESCSYDLSVTQLARLKREGVSSVVLAALIRRCGGASANSSGRGDSAALEPGVWLQIEIAGRHLYERVIPALVVSGQSKGNGSILLPRKSMLTLPGDTAKVVAQTPRPYFIVTLKSAIAAADFRSNVDGVPIELFAFKLVKFRIKDGQRSLPVDSFSTLGDFSGLDHGKTFPLAVSKVRDRSYSVVPTTLLTSGEYAIVAEVRPSTYEIFDFRVVQQASEIGIARPTE